ncbi:MAG: 6-carboxytetrahydropterin synthase QueD [Dehalococcoidales bacterium]|nr:6-carboxytetrahydropterin synthase QueD [Dehalococcoidales bacterium]
MYTVSIERHFDAAHYLRDYQGKCENLHGHRYKVVATVKTSELDDIDLAFDFTVLKTYLDTVLERYDHTCLNDIEPFDKINASSENIASTIYNELLPALEGHPATLESVGVWESPDSWVIYTTD